MKKATFQQDYLRHYVQRYRRRSSLGEEINTEAYLVHLKHSLLHFAIWTYQADKKIKMQLLRSICTIYANYN